jgi:Leucine Rich repeat
MSNLCTSAQSKDKGKIYRKEHDRLRDYYDAGQASKVRVVAEFYIEDNPEVQAIKMSALADFLTGPNSGVANFNFSTNQMSLQTLNSLNSILSNTSPTLQELTLSRCRLGQSHINSLMFSVPSHTFMKLTTLLKLNLSENRINDKGAAMISAYIIHHNPHILLGLNLD